MGDANLDTSLIDTAAGTSQQPPPDVRGFVDANNAAAAAPAKRLEEIDAQLAEPPKGDAAIRRQRDEALKSERDIMIQQQSERTAQRDAAQGPASNTGAAATDGAPAADASTTTAPKSGAQPAGGTKFVDPTGADSPVAQGRAQVEQLAGIEAANPKAIIGGGRASAAMVPVGGATSTQQTLPTQGEVDAVAQYEDAARRLGQTDQMQAQREVAGAQKIADVEAEKAQLAAKAAEDAQREQMQINADTDARLSKYESAAADYAKASDKGIDPNRLWNQASTGQKIGASIGILLSGIGSGLQGGRENLALKQINDAVDRDVQAQAIGLTAKSRGLDVQRSVMQAAMDAGASKMDAMTIARNKGLEAANQRIAAAIAATKVPDLKESLMRVQAQNDMRIAQNRQQLTASMRQTVHQQMQQRRVVTGGGITATEAANRARAVMGTPKFDNKLYSPMLGVQFGDAETLRANNEKARQMQVVKSMANDLRGLRKKYGVNWVDRVGRAKAEAYANQLAVAMTVANQQGAMSKGDHEISEAITTGGGNALDLLSTVGARTEVLDRIADVTTSSLRDEGMEPDRVPPVYKLKARARDRMAELDAAKGDYR